MSAQDVEERIEAIEGNLERVRIKYRDGATDGEEDEDWVLECLSDAEAALDRLFGMR